jgi:2-polyprenyl-3-methyl-5-hydroxy-6-metoxy-1,4-benzoquinol methylase
VSQQATTTDQHAKEVASGERFEFGKNWAEFLKLLNDDRIRVAEESVQDMLESKRLDGLSFIDVGCGSGIFSLAARRLGARVRSFDFDPHSANCARELKRRYFPNDPNWTIEEGSVLDKAYLSTLGQHDIVYSWGVLHHTGQMWTALDNVTPLVAPNGRLFISIYNDQGKISRRWTSVKKAYNGLPRALRFLVLWPAAWHMWWRPIVKDFLFLRPFHQWREYNKKRGMSPWRDIVDWVGGYPFEVAKPEAIFDFYRARGFQLDRLSTCGGTLGCNQFVMRKVR